MKNMKRIITIMLAAAMLVPLAACGQKDTASDQYTQTYSAVGEIVNSGMFKAVCPRGWHQAYAYNITESTEKPDADTLIFVKGGTGVDEDKPYIKITYYKQDAQFNALDSSGYGDVQTVPPFIAGSNTFSGFTALVSGQRFAYLTAAGENGTFEVYLWMHVGSDIQAMITDSDVNSILSSIISASKK